MSPFVDENESASEVDNGCCRKYINLSIIYKKWRNIFINYIMFMESIIIQTISKWTLFEVRFPSHTSMVFEIVLSSFSLGI